MVLPRRRALVRTIILLPSLFQLFVPCMDVGQADLATQFILSKKPFIVLLFHSSYDHRTHETGLGSLLSSTWGREKASSKRGLKPGPTPRHRGSSCLISSGIHPAKDFSETQCWEVHMARLRTSQRLSVRLLCHRCCRSSFRRRV